MKTILIITLVAIGYLVLTHQIVLPVGLDNVPSQQGFTNLKAEAYNDALNVGINPDYFVRQINQESGFNPQAYNSQSGASGIAQFIPSTAAAWGVDPWDPHSALMGAARYMRHYQDIYGSYRAALVAYNCGPGCVGRPLPSETVQYINVIMN